MKAILTTGNTIELIKNCGCVTHDGPHWLHMDVLTHRMNSELLENGFVNGLLDNEMRRLDEKARNMARLNIDRIEG